MVNTTKQMMELYFQEKEVYKRNEILNHLLCNMPVDAKEFFLKAFKKERHLDMKLSAVRGYSAYATEDEVAVLMKKLLDLLKKIPEHTPYDYSDYESMRSVFFDALSVTALQLRMLPYVQRSIGETIQRYARLL